MLTTDEYLASIHMALMESPIVLEYTIVRQRLTSQSGHLRVRVHLANGDFLESAEFFRLGEEGIGVVDYRHQWMNADQTILHKRWDSTPHHPELENSPYHIHIGSEENVLPGQILSIQAVLKVIAGEIG